MENSSKKQTDDEIYLPGGGIDKLTSKAVNKDDYFRQMQRRK